MNRLFLRYRLTCVPAVVTGIIILFLFLPGCNSLLDSLFDNALPQEEGELELPGLTEKVTVKRDNMGIPFVDAANLDDLVIAQGYVSACDRFAQMEGFRLVGQGRLSEMIGPAAVEMDTYLRAMNVNKAAEIVYNSASADLRNLLRLYSQGVNAYLDMHPLPMTIKLTGHKPEQWEPMDCVSVFIVFTLGLSQNLHEEIGILNLAQKIDPKKLAWLTPIYPDELLPFEEMKKLEGVDLAAAGQDLENIFSAIQQTNRLVVPAAAASNNWAVSGKRTKSGKPILANDTHLPLVMPSFWHLMKVRCPDHEGAGVALAGVPGIIAGYNGHIAAGLTMVMADNQDVFLEQLKEKDDGLYYLYKGEWIKTTTRLETIKVKGEKDVTLTVHETVHGPLMNRILTTPPRHLLVPMPVEDQSLGIAVSWAAFEPDRTMDIFFNIMRANSVDEILTWTRSSRTVIPLNMVMADEKDIAWQVTGRFPVRKKGRGLCPSPGWTGEYDWQGYLNPFLHPMVKNPPKGYIGTANNRTVSMDFPHTLSSSWYYPDRAQRIDEMIGNAGTYSVDDARAMQSDIFSPFVANIKKALLNRTTIEQMTGVWKEKEGGGKAESALNVLRKFDGNMRVESAGAAFCGAFMNCLIKNLFADECGGTDTLAWDSLTEIFLMAYSSPHDHLTPRGQNSPFWDDVTTKAVEQRHDILAASVLDALDLLGEVCGPAPDQWQWGKLHQYEWKTDASRFAPYMGFPDRTWMKFLSGYFDRGPYPAPGDHTTLNVSGYHPGNDFDTWLVPVMRIIVDFGSKEPMIGINSSGQSDNPASPHYEDGIQAWLKGEYQPLPFQEANIEKQFTKILVLTPES